MKKIMFLVTTVIMFVAVMSSCKKSDSGSASIVGKWTFLKIVHKTTVISTNSVTNSTDNYNDGSYTNFRTDGQVENYTPSSGSVINSYSVSGNNLIISLQAYVIQVLDASNLQIYWTQTTSGSKYEQTIYLSK